MEPPLLPPWSSSARNLAGIAMSWLILLHALAPARRHLADPRPWPILQRATPQGLCFRSSGVAIPLCCSLPRARLQGSQRRLPSCARPLARGCLCPAVRRRPRLAARCLLSQLLDDDEVMLDRFLLRVDCGTYVEDSIAFSKINLGSFL
jgi:hypothetical protein